MHIHIDFFISVSLHLFIPLSLYSLWLFISSSLLRFFSVSTSFSPSILPLSPLHVLFELKRTWDHFLSSGLRSGRFEFRALPFFFSSFLCFQQVRSSQRPPICTWHVWVKCVATHLRWILRELGIGNLSSQSSTSVLGHATGEHKGSVRVQHGQSAESIISKKAT